ncbi:MAG: hypothetical protein ACFFF4_03770 [Candidatus Thorarchaeota archaeon]
MQIRWAVTFGILLSLFFIPTTAMAHIPIGGGGDSLETATEVVNPQNSWVAYTELYEGAEPQYFKASYSTGERIDIRLAIPMELVDTDFRPILVIMGPGLTNQSTPPGYLEIPIGAGVMVFDSEPEFAEYEGFTPSSFYLVADVDFPSPQTGIYYFAIFEPDSGERYSIVFGHIEAYTLWDWISIPLITILVHTWDGQDYFEIFAPYVAAFMIGLGLLLYRKPSLRTDVKPLNLIGIIGSLMIGATSFSIIQNTIIALLGAPINVLIVVTIFVILNSLIGSFIATRILVRENLSRKDSAKLIIIAIFAFALWAGYIIGPTLLSLVGLISLATKLRSARIE